MRPDLPIPAVLVLVLASGGCSSSAPGEEHPAASARGISSDVFGINVAGDGPGGAAIQVLGARWARLELRDETTGPELSADAVQRIAASLDDYRAHGIQVLLVLDYMTRAGFGGQAASTNFCPPHGDWYGWRADLVARAAHAAQVLGDRVDAWQIWNEPDHPCGVAAGYDPFVDPHELAWLAQGAFAAIRTGSDAPVVLGGLESGDPSYMDEMVAATGGSLSDYGDGIGVQIYGVVPNDDWCVPGGPAEDEYLSCAWGRLAGKVDQYWERSGGLPVWVTEVGFRTGDAEKQADYLQDAYAAFASNGDRLARAFWFAWSDAMVAPFGLTDETSAPKPAYWRYQALAGGGGACTCWGGDACGTEGCHDDGRRWRCDEAGDWQDLGACPAPSLSCGELAARSGWASSLCEWNDNAACGGTGSPTWDCDHCCPE